jgi:hypothetical protein
MKSIIEALETFIYNCYAWEPADETGAICSCENCRARGDCDFTRALAQARERQEPLTDEEIAEIAKPFINALGDRYCNELGIPESSVEDFARAIERKVKYED